MARDRIDRLPVSYAGIWRTTDVIKHMAVARPIMFKREVVEMVCPTVRWCLFPKKTDGDYWLKETTKKDGNELLEFNGVSLLRRQLNEICYDLDPYPHITSPEGVSLLIKLMQAKVFEFGSADFKISQALQKYQAESWSFHVAHPDILY